MSLVGESNIKPGWTDIFVRPYSCVSERGIWCRSSETHNSQLEEHSSMLYRSTCDLQDKESYLCLFCFWPVHKSFQYTWGLFHKHLTCDSDGKEYYLGLSCFWSVHKSCKYPSGLFNEHLGTSKLQFPGKMYHYHCE